MAPKKRKKTNKAVASKKPKLNDSCNYENTLDKSIDEIRAYRTTQNKANKDPNDSIKASDLKEYFNLIIGEAGRYRLTVKLADNDVAKRFLLDALSSKENVFDASNCSYCFSLDRIYDGNLYNNIEPDGFCFYRLINHFIRIREAENEGLDLPESDFEFRNINDRNIFIENWKLLLSYYNEEKTNLGLTSCFDKKDPLFNKYLEKVKNMINVVENFYQNKTQSNFNVILDDETFWGNIAYVRFIPNDLCAATLFYPRQNYLKYVKTFSTKKIKKFNGQVYQGPIYCQMICMKKILVMC